MGFSWLDPDKWRDGYRQDFKLPFVYWYCWLAFWLCSNVSWARWPKPCQWLLTSPPTRPCPWFSLKTNAEASQGQLWWEKSYFELLPRHFTVWQPYSHPESGQLDKDLSLGFPSRSLHFVSLKQLLKQLLRVKTMKLVTSAQLPPR